VPVPFSQMVLKLLLSEVPVPALVDVIGSAVTAHPLSGIAQSAHLNGFLKRALVGQHPRERGPVNPRSLKFVKRSVRQAPYRIGLELAN
jgi:hypothetical protein